VLFAANFLYDKWFAKLGSLARKYLSKFMSWFNKKKMNEQDLDSEELIEEIENEFAAGDNRRFNEDGERISVEPDVKKEGKTAKVKSSEVTKLENELKDVWARCNVAETKLVEVQKRFDDAKNNLEKETAEMRQRLTKTLEDRAKQGQFNFLMALLPVLDNLNLAVSASEKDSSFEHLLEGVKGTARSFEKALISVGVEAVPSVGSEFDPELHEAIDMTEIDADGDGKITAEYSRGYKFGDKLLRPARVQVGKARAQSVGE
jgi:molecular chaperone GrpE